MLPTFITWDVSPVIFSIGPLQVRWYGLMFALGFFIGYKIVERMFRHEGCPERWLGPLLAWLIAGTIVGARLGHCFFYEWERFSQHPVEILYIWQGGLASHGGTIGCIICVTLFALITAKKSPLWAYDRVIVPIALVACLIRIGNLFNSEIYGHITTLPWGFIFVRDGQTLPAHPTQLYEAACYLALFITLMFMYWKHNDEDRPGLLFGLAMIWIFGTRFFIEFVKNPQEAFEENMALNMGQWLSIPFVVLGIILVARALARPKIHMTFPDRWPDEPKPKSRQGTSR